LTFPLLTTIIADLDQKDATAIFVLSHSRIVVVVVVVVAVVVAVVDVVEISQWEWRHPKAWGCW